MSGDDQEGHFHIGESEGDWDSDSHLWEMPIFTIQGNRIAIYGKRNPSGILEARRVGHYTKGSKIWDSSHSLGRKAGLANIKKRKACRGCL